LSSSNDCNPPSENLPSMASETSIFFAIKSEATGLYRLRIMQVKHADSLALSDAPRSPARLPQSVERISGFIEDQRGVAQQIKARLDNSWVTDRDLDIFVKLLFEPGLPSPTGQARSSSTW
jgi:hypothetical protein